MSENNSSPIDKSEAKVTPMMAQFVEIKAANPGSLLFYRMGDFYELFFDDAETASRALGITLTKRGKHLGKDIPMCGVPFHAADGYLQKLIKLGHRVSVCEQLENPADAKKRGHKSVVRRGVVRLVTPGTITEEKLLDPSSSSYLCALSLQHVGEGEQSIALSWIDLSTGAFRTSGTDTQNLSADLARIDARELILSQSVFDNPDIKPHINHTQMAITPLPGNLFDSAMAERKLCNYFAVKSLNGFGNFSKSELAAAAAILAYVEKTQISEKPALAPPTSESSSQVMLIDAATRANLELVYTLSGARRGSLLKAIDHTLSGPGARELSRRLMAPLLSCEKITARHEAISFLLGNSQLLQTMREYLKSAPDMARALSRLALNRGGPRDLKSLHRGFLLAEKMARNFSDSKQLPQEIGNSCTCLTAIGGTLPALLEGALADELPLLARDGGFIKSGYHKELDKLRALRDHSRQIIMELQSTYVQQSGIKTLKIKHNNVLGYFVEVSAAQASSLQNDENRATFIHRQTLANVMRFTTTRLAELETSIANAAGSALEIELKIFEQLREKLVAERQMIFNAADALAALDVAGSHAHLAVTQNYCRPVMSDDLQLTIDNGRHPVIEQVLHREGQDSFVANNCEIGPKNTHEKGAIWLLTGPNMGGKSTFLRQNALIVLLAQMGAFVPADKARIGIVDRLFSRVGASDDLSRGRSTFMVEMVETAAILNQATNKSFVILDEIGRGTATFDGLSIAWAAIEHLHEVNQCRAIFATHYHELVALATSLGRLTNVTMKVKEWQGEVVFLHEVIAGAADRSYGIQVAKLAGLPLAVIERARDVLNQLESSERQNSAKQMIDDLPLFNADIKPARNNLDGETLLADALNELSPDELSPRQALEKLYQLRAMLTKDK